MAHGFWAHRTHSLLVVVSFVTGCSLIGDFGAFEDEPGTTEGPGDGDGDGLASGDGDGDTQTTSDGDGDGDSASGGNVSGDGDGDTVETTGDGDGDTGGTMGDGDGDTGGGSGGGGTGGSGSGGEASGGTGSGGEHSGSVGCGNADHLTTGVHTLNAEGEARTFRLDVPSDYDPDQPYSLVFAFHANGGTAASIASGGFFDLRAQANGSTIFVAIQGIDNNWSGVNDRDVNVTAAVLDHLQADLCIDSRHVFAVGFSAGAFLVNSIGCSLGDRFSAIVPYSGGLFLGCAEGTEPVAFLGFHGQNDDVVQIEMGREARDEFRLRNGCWAATSDWGSNGCIQYSNCAARSPVIWCETGGPHSVPNFAAEDTWDFLSLMAEL